MENATASGVELEQRPRLLTDMFDLTVLKHPNWTAIDFMGAKTSWRTLRDVVDRAAAGLRSLGLCPGGRVGLCLPNTPHYPILFLAVLRAGGVVVNINPLYVERELRHLVSDAGVDIIATCDIPDVHARVSAVAAELGVRHVVNCPIASALPTLAGLGYRIIRRSEIAIVPRDDRHVPFADLIGGYQTRVQVDIGPDDVGVLQYTGGTTGHPKAAMLTHANLVAQADATALHLKVDDSVQGRTLGVIPLFHVFALTTVLGLALRTGSMMILLPRYELQQTLKTISRTRPTHFPAVPTIFHAIGEHAAGRHVDLSDIKICISGGAPLPAEVRDTFVKHTGARLIEGYGLSEASPIITCNPIDGGDRPGSAGQPYPGTTIEIRDPDAPHAIRPPGVPGEICARGSQVMLGYWGKPEETEAVFCEGALRTGDIGYLDAEGFLFIIDRIKDVILCGGYNVYPRMIEEALYEHPSVAEAVVIAIPHPYRGQCPKAFVTLRSGEQADGTELRDFLRDKVSKIELPIEVVVRDTLPKTLVGKLSKKELIEEEQARRAAEATAVD